MITFEELTSWLVYQQLFAGSAGQGRGAAGGADSSEREPAPFLFNMKGIGMLFLSPLNRRMQTAFGLNPGIRALSASPANTTPSAGSGRLRRRCSDPTLHLAGSSVDNKLSPGPTRKRAADDMNFDQSDDTDESDTESDYNLPSPPPGPSGTRFVPLGVINPESGFVPIVIKTEEEFQPMPNEECENPEIKQVVPMSHYSRINSDHLRQRPGMFGYSLFGRTRGAGASRSNFANMCSAVNEAFQKQRGQRKMWTSTRQQMTEEHIMPCTAAHAEHFPPMDAGGAFSQLGHRFMQAHSPDEPYTTTEETVVYRSHARSPPPDSGLYATSGGEERDSGYWDLSRGQESHVSTREPSPQLTSTPASARMGVGPAFGFPPPPGMTLPSQRVPNFGAMPMFGQPRAFTSFGGMGRPGFHTGVFGGSAPRDIPSSSSLTITEISGSPSANSDITLVGSPSSHGVMCSQENRHSFIHHTPAPPCTISDDELTITDHKMSVRGSRVELSPIPDVTDDAAAGLDSNKTQRMNGTKQFVSDGDAIIASGGFANVPKAAFPMMGPFVTTAAGFSNTRLFAGDNKVSVSNPNYRIIEHADIATTSETFTKVEQGAVMKTLQSEAHAVNHDIGATATNGFDTAPEAPFMSTSKVRPPDQVVSSDALLPLTSDLSLALPSATANTEGVPKVMLDPHVEADMTLAVREAAGTLAIPSSEPWVVCAAVPKTSANDPAAVSKAVDKGAIIALPASQAASAMKDLEAESSLGSDSSLSFMVDEDTQTIADEDMFAFYEMEMQDYHKHPSWMSELPQALLDIPLTKLAIPGSHIALAIEGDMRTDMDFSKCNLEMLDILRKLPDFAIFNAFRKQMKRIWKSWMPKQALSVYQQLEAGSRYLDLQLAKHKKHFYGEHGLYTGLFTGYLQQLQLFLDANPKEVVLVHFRKLEGYTRKDKRQLLTDLFQMFSRRLCSTDFKARFTLSSLWAAQKQLVLIFPTADLELFRGHIFDRFIFSDNMVVESRVPKMQDTGELMEELEEDYEDLEEMEERDRFHLMHAFLSPDLNMVFGEYQHKCMGDLTLGETNPNLASWVEQKPLLNVLVLDFVGGGDVVGEVIGLNHRKAGADNH